MDNGGMKMDTDKLIEQFYETKVRPFLMDDSIPWEVLEEKEKDEIRKLYLTSGKDEQ